MKTFREFIKEDGIGAVPANAVGDGKNVAGVTGDPIKKKGILKTVRRKNCI